MAPEVTHEPALAEQTLRAGATLNIHVKITGLPTPTVAWTHGDQKIVQSNGTTIETKEGFSTLTIRGTDGENSGTYKVTATNVVDSDSAEFSVTIKGMCHP